LYSIDKGGLRALELGPEVGYSRKEALGKLLCSVELEVGRLILNDEWRARKGRKEERGGVCGKGLGVGRLGGI